MRLFSWKLWTEEESSDFDRFSGAQEGNQPPPRFNIVNSALLSHSTPPSISPYNTSRHRFNLLSFQLRLRGGVFSLIGGRAIFSHVWKRLKTSTKNSEIQVFT